MKHPGGNYVTGYQLTHVMQGQLDPMNDVSITGNAPTNTHNYIRPHGRSSLQFCSSVGGKDGYNLCCIITMQQLSNHSRLYLFRQLSSLAFYEKLGQHAERLFLEFLPTVTFDHFSWTFGLILMFCNF